MKSKELKIYNLPKDDIAISQIDAKPTLFFASLIFIGFISLALPISKIYGISLLIFGIIAMIYMPRVVMLEFYQDYMILYNRADKDVCTLVYYDEVSSWNYARGARRDYLYIELENGRIEKTEGFSRSLFESQMNRFLKDKSRKNSK